MGYAIAEECANRGAKVTIISGPTNISVQNQKINIINVESAKDMHSLTIKHFKNSDIAILSAAVSDFTPTTTTESKLKRKSQNIAIELKPTADIAADLGNIKRSDQILIGFALEKENETSNAIGKLKRKKLDFIILNSMNDKGAGFNTNTNKITIINNKEEVIKFKLKSKNLVANDIIDNLEDYL